MSSQGKTDTNNKGKAREEIAQASGSGPSAQVHPDEQGSDMGSTVSHLDLSTLSTTPPLHTVNKNIGQWLNTTQTPSGAGSPSMQNQENAMLSSDPGSMILDELSQELNTLATRPLNTRGKPGTSAPANTPQSCDHNGLRARAHSTGDANGRRLRMGPQANTMDGSVLPLPLFSKSNSSTAAGTSTSTPQAHQTSTIIDEIQLKDPGLPGKSVKSTSSPHATPQAAGVTETNLSTSLTMDVSPNPECSTGTPALAGTANSSLGLAQHVLQLHQGIPVSAAHLVVENTVGRPSALTNAVPSISSPAVAGIDGNVHGPAQDLSNLNQFVYQSATQLLVENMVSRPSSPLIIRQNAQQTADLPTVPPSTAPLEQVVNEPESVHHSPTAPLFHDFSSIGRRHSLQASTVFSPRHPKGRAKRIMQDLKQILKGCFCRNRGIKKTSTELDHRNINEPSTLPVDEHRDGSRTGDIFERTGDKMAEHAKSLPSLDGRLRRGVLPLAGGHPEGDASPPPEQRTLSNESSNTAQEASNDSDPPANVGARPKNFLRRWKAKRAAAAHERAMMRRRVEQDAALHRNVQDLLSSDGIPLRFDQSSGLGLFEM